MIQDMPVFCVIGGRGIFNRTFDPKVMIAVGLIRWFLNMQREEIQLLFFGRGFDDYSEQGTSCYTYIMSVTKVVIKTIIHIYVHVHMDGCHKN